MVAELRSPIVLSLLERREKKRPVLDTCTRWGSTYLMIKRLLELRNSIEELGVLSPEFLLSTATWSSLNKLLSVLEGPYAVTLKLQAEDLTSGVFMKKWCSLKHILRGKQTSLALEEQWKKEKSFISKQTLLGWSFCRCEIPYSAF